MSGAGRPTVDGSLRPPRGLGARDLLVKAVFRTVQGEGPFSGVPAVFVRLAGCNLRCWYCDTDYRTGGARSASVDSVAWEVIERMRGDRRGGESSIVLPGIVVLTGGEPLAQRAAVLLVRRLLAHGRRVQVETAGTLWPSGLPVVGRLADRLLVVVSPKTPSLHPRLEADAAAYPERFAWKYVLRDGEEPGLPLRRATQATRPPPPEGGRSAERGRDQNAQEILGLPLPGEARVGIEWRNEPPAALNWRLRPPAAEEVAAGRVFVQPMDENDAARNADNVRWCGRLAARAGYRLSIQAHKVAGLP